MMVVIQRNTLENSVQKYFWDQIAICLGWTQYKFNSRSAFQKISNVYVLVTCSNEGDLGDLARGTHTTTT